ncbi:MAG: acyltransferase family protein [Desulfobacterota bacterium]|jgi:hypothetical protein|nr:acyltransferase family protein [Thermodesulfobacteriota bacterium]
MVWVDKAKILATLGVVVTHVSASTLFGLRDPHSLNWWAANCYDPLARFAVPFFVMISGCLLLDPAKEEPWGVFYKKRARRILPPLDFHPRSVGYRFLGFRADRPGDQPHTFFEAGGGLRLSALFCNYDRVFLIIRAKPALVPL